MRPLLITGCNGFVGRRLTDVLARRGCNLRGAVRSPAALEEARSLPADPIIVGPIGPETSWTQALQGVDVVIHLAARTHILHETAPDPAAEFHRVNTAGTRALAQAAAKAGAKRFVLLSSIGVCGVSTPDSIPFTEDSPPRPQEPYAVSKWEAEQAVWEVCAATDMEAVVLRSPLVYGAGNIKGNMLRLLNAVHRGRFLPLGSVRNLRSFIGLVNLADALAVCALDPQAADQTFLISDGADVSTPDLIRKTAAAMGKRANLWPFPQAGLSLAGAIYPPIGRALKRLCDSLLIDSGRFRKTLGWEPPQTLDQGIQSMAADYLARTNRS
jgi:nucleoside-diphosphate-sugar epimerase